MGISLKSCKYYRVFRALLVLLIVVAICGQTVCANSQTGSLQLNCKAEYNGNIMNLSGDTYAIVQIATATETHPDFIEYQICPEFAELDCDWNSLTDHEKQDQAKKLQMRAEHLNLLKNKKNTDPNGVVKFESLHPGLYLVVRTSCSKKNQIFIAAPFLVSIPTVINEAPIYSIVATPKFEVDQELYPPQTGDRNNILFWLVLLFVSGYVFCIAIIKRKQRNNKGA